MILTLDYTDPRSRPHITSLFARHRQRQADMLRAFGTVPAPRIGESGPPTHIGLAIAYNDPVPARPGDQCDELVFLPGSLDAAIARARDVVGLLFHDERRCCGRSTVGTLQLELCASGLLVGLIKPSLPPAPWRGCSASLDVTLADVVTIDGVRVGLLTAVDLFEIGIYYSEPSDPRWVPLGSRSWFSEATPEAWQRLALARGA